MKEVRFLYFTQTVRLWHQWTVILCIYDIKPISTIKKVEGKIDPKTLYGNINGIQKSV